MSSEPEEQYDPESTAGVPEHGRERLERMKATGGGFFTSDLSVNEFLLVKAAGFEPLGLVVGTSIYHVGVQLAGWKQSQEMDVLSQAMYHARELAMTRMEEEADQLGADGVVGVRLDVSRHEWGGDLAEFIAIGTAVRHREGVLHRAPSGRPFTSDLTGQDFYTLLSAGYRPVGLVMGTCVYHVAHQGVGGFLKRIGRNQEMPNFTQALYDARELAMERMQAEGEALEAEGIVGVQLQEGSHGWDSHVIEYFAVGTAVVPTSADHTIPAPSFVLTLNDASQNRLTGF
ncbi:MAG TPA: heavy metal-binding domain-containing protein [Gaiellaceae bacterium]|nr:heavy metal-binding domain-containing protein [Gaiellaceae bacterium]